MTEKRLTRRSLDAVLRGLPGALREGDAPELSRSRFLCSHGPSPASPTEALFSLSRFGRSGPSDDRSVPAGSPRGRSRRSPTRRRRSSSPGDVEFFVEEAAAKAPRDARRRGRGGPAVRGRRAGRVGLGRAPQPLALFAAAARRARHLAPPRHGVAGQPRRRRPSRRGRRADAAGGGRRSSRRGRCSRRSTSRRRALRQENGRGRGEEGPQEGRGADSWRRS